MSKDSTISTQAPQLFSIGGHVFAEPAQLVASQLNHSFGARPQTHFASYGAGVTTGRLAGIWSAVSSTIGVWRSVIDISVRVRPEVLSLVYRTRLYIYGDCEMSVRWTIGSAAAATINGYIAGNHDQLIAATVNTSSTGTGWLRVLVEIKRSAGTGDGGLLSAGLRDATISGANLPSPQDD